MDGSSSTSDRMHNDFRALKHMRVSMLKPCDELKARRWARTSLLRGAHFFHTLSLQLCFIRFLGESRGLIRGDIGEVLEIWHRQYCS